MKTFIDAVLTIFVLGPIAFFIICFGIYFLGVINSCKLILWILIIAAIISIIIKYTGKEEESEDE